MSNEALSGTYEKETRRDEMGDTVLRFVTKTRRTRLSNDRHVKHKTKERKKKKKERTKERLL